MKRVSSCLDYLREGDILVIYKLDRLGRTTKQLIELSQWLEENNIDLHIIDMNVSTKDAMGKMFFTMMSAFSELEANRFCCKVTFKRYTVKLTKTRRFYQ